MISEKSRIILNEMVKDGSIPKVGTFEITQSLIEISYKKWCEKYHPNYSKRLTPSTIRYGKKIAGISLMKFNQERIESITIKKETKSKKDQQCGIVYIITNPAFPGHYKIGMTTDLDSRLKSYQTYDPLQRYKVEHYIFVTDRRKVEAHLLNHFKIDAAKGEWITNEEVKKKIIELTP